MMFGPHIVAGLLVSSLNSFTSSWQSLRRGSFAILAMNSATLTFVGLVLFSAMRTLHSGNRSIELGILHDSILFEAQAFFLQ